MSGSSKATPASRIQLFDVLRGVAMGLMATYHFCFDLNYYGFTHFNFNHDSFWLGFRALILSLFLGLAGISLMLATAGGVRCQSTALFAQAWMAYCLRDIGQPIEPHVISQ